MVSEELFRDLASAMRKPYPVKKNKQADYEALVSRLCSGAELIDVHSVVEACRDPKDNFLLALVKEGSADYLITGDKDLLIMKELENTKIVTLPDFEAAASIEQSRNF